MILGLEQHWHAQCFLELDDAVRQLTDRLVVFNAHSKHVHGLTPPEGSILYSLENLAATPQWAVPASDGTEIWDFNKSNLALYPAGANAAYVPVGYHSSMERFSRSSPGAAGVDVAFSGGMNERRVRFFEEIRKRGFSVEIIQPWGTARNEILGKARLVINMHSNVNPSLFESVRVSHLLANRVPVVTEESTHREEGEWGLVGHNYEKSADAVEAQLRRPQEELEREASNLYEKFRQMPMQVLA